MPRAKTPKERTWDALGGLRKLALAEHESCPPDLTVTRFVEEAERLTRRVERRIKKSEDISTARWEALKKIVRFVMKHKIQTDSEEWEAIRKSATEALDGILPESKEHPLYGRTSPTNYDSLDEPIKSAGQPPPAPASAPA